MNRLLRFTLAERVVHWMVALGFVYAALTGLGLWSPRLYWLAAVLGGGPTVRGWHPWAGVVFFACFAVMFRGWHRQMLLDPDDRRWLRSAHRYAVHDEAGLPDAGRFNAGQKMLFWTQGTSALVLLASGVVLWWPETMPRVLRLAAILAHPVAAVVSIAGLIVHVYMGTAAVPGAFRAMIHGWVSPAWAASHHRRWHREVRRG